MIHFRRLWIFFLAIPFIASCNAWAPFDAAGVFAPVDAANKAPALVYSMLFGLGADGGLYEAAKMAYGARNVLETFYGQNNFGEIDVPHVTPTVSASFCQGFLNVYKNVMNEETATFP